jgi:hypothetical protein
MLAIQKFVISHDFLPIFDWWVLMLTPVGFSRSGPCGPATTKSPLAAYINQGEYLMKLRRPSGQEATTCLALVSLCQLLVSRITGQMPSQYSTCAVCASIRI